MATPTPSRTRYPPRPAGPKTEDVNPLWLLKAVGVTVVGALVCGYLTLCLLVYQGQWQLVLHPDTSAPAVPAGVQALRFGALESGQPRLNGWWEAAGVGSALTVLVMHDGSGNLETNAALVSALHGAGVNVFAFDYRGFGGSEATHPNQRRMTEDAEAALTYLESTRHVEEETIVAYGAGLGAGLAGELVRAHPGLGGVVMEAPQPDTLGVVRQDGRAGLVPLGWLFRERFDPAEALRSSRLPKLLLTAGPAAVTPLPDARKVEDLFRSAAAPAMTVHLARPVQDAAYQDALRRFLDENARLKKETR